LSRLRTSAPARASRGWDDHQAYRSQPDSITPAFAFLQWARTAAARELRDSDFRVLALLVGHTITGRPTWSMSMRALAAESGLSLRAVRYAVARLCVEGGPLTVERGGAGVGPVERGGAPRGGGRRCGTVFRVNLGVLTGASCAPVTGALLAPVPPPTGAPACTVPGQAATPTGATPCTGKRPYEETLEETAGRPAGRGDELVTDFVEYYRTNSKHPAVAPFVSMALSDWRERCGVSVRETMQHDVLRRAVERLERQEVSP
jgi:hypothetical protein